VIAGRTTLHTLLLEGIIVKSFFFFVSVAALLLVPFAARSQSMAMSAFTPGAGPHGYDWIIGTWACTNSVPSPLGGPSSTTFVVARSNAGSALFARVTGKNFDESWYLTYAAKTKTWWVPTAYADGSYEIESSTSTGKKVVWAGSYYSAAGKAMKVRDLFTNGPTKTNDVGQYQSGSAWKTLYNVTCSKS